MPLDILLLLFCMAVYALKLKLCVVLEQPLLMSSVGRLDFRLTATHDALPAGLFDLSCDDYFRGTGEDLLTRLISSQSYEVTLMCGINVLCYIFLSLRHELQ